jgi:hypothetical protein
MTLNKSFSEYCKNSTNESIRKITEKYNSNKNKPKIKLNLDDDNNNPDFNFYDFIFFLSVTTIAFLIYKRLK